MNFIRELPQADELIAKSSLNPEQQKTRAKRIRELQNILQGKDRRKILLVGPCSADRADAVLEYAGKLASIQEQVVQKILIIPRIYTAKPRTSGIGYKGLLHSPGSPQSREDMWSGIIAMRKLHMDIINNCGLFCADEMLYPEIVYYCMDILAYLTVGARSVEDQAHRMTASALDIPVGMKNPICGNMQSLLNSIYAAQHAQTMVFHGWEVQSDGNPFAHAILRGYQDNQNLMHPNYHFEDLCVFHDMYLKANLKNASLIVDCNHCNSGKRYDQQGRIAEEVLQSCRYEKSLNDLIKGLMIESYLEDGSQLLSEGVYGKSITDGCLGWKKTEELILFLADMIQ